LEDNISLNINQGEIIYDEPNGSGKTTLIRLSGWVQPTVGTLSKWQ
jgi:ABC-type transport system involved in cytochrome c biogenesis ATPase subunit